MEIELHRFITLGRAPAGAVQLSPLTVRVTLPGKQSLHAIVEFNEALPASHTPHDVAPVLTAAEYTQFGVLVHDAARCAVVLPVTFTAWHAATVDATF